MVFILPPEFYAPDCKELPMAQLDFGPRPVIFEKPREKKYKHLKSLYLKGYINDHPVNKMLVDTGAAVNIISYIVLRWLGHSAEDLIKTNVTLSDFNGQVSYPGSKKHRTEPSTRVSKMFNHTHNNNMIN
jgi:hypothetical protein